VVQPGDTLSGIARRYGVDMAALARANGLPPPYLIRVGQRLALPPRGAYPRTESRPLVQPLPRYTPPPAPQPTFPSQAPAMTPTAAPRLVWPADGPVAERFGQGADPRGLAIAGHTGAAVRAAAGGTVIFAGTEPQRYGQLVVVDHGGGWVTAYGHLSRLVVSTGDAVRANARLGFVGTTAGGEPRLHFELRRDNVPVDPLPRLPARF
jgi:lipoprotein NlpD